MKHIKTFESINEAASKRSDLTDVIDSFNTDNPKSDIRLNEPGTKVWKDSWGKSHREPGYIKSHANKNPREYTTDLWDQIKKIKKIVSLGDMNMVGIETPVEVYRLGRYYFAPVPISNGLIGKIEFGSTSRLKNTMHFKK